MSWVCAGGWLVTIHGDQALRGPWGGRHGQWQALSMQIPPNCGTFLWVLRSLPVSVAMCFLHYANYVESSLRISFHPALSLQRGKSRGWARSSKATGPDGPSIPTMGPTGFREAHLTLHVCRCAALAHRRTFLLAFLFLKMHLFSS